MQLEHLVVKWYTFLASTYFFASNWFRWSIAAIRWLDDIRIQLPTLTAVSAGLRFRPVNKLISRLHLRLASRSPISSQSIAVRLLPQTHGQVVPLRVAVGLAMTGSLKIWRAVFLHWLSRLGGNDKRSNRKIVSNTVSYRMHTPLQRALPEPPILHLKSTAFLWVNCVNYFTKKTESGGCFITLSSV